MEAKQHITKQPMEHLKKLNRKLKEREKRDKWQWKYNDTKHMGHGKSDSKREIYDNTILPQGIKIIQNK